MNLRPPRLRARSTSDPAPAAHHRPPAGARRPAVLLGVAASGALLVGVLSAGQPADRVESVSESVSIAEQLGIPAGGAAVTEDLGAAAVEPLEQLAASRAERDAARTAAAQAQAAADQAERDRLAAEEAARVEAARVEAERVAAERAAAEAAARAAAEAEAAEAAAAEAAAAPAPAAPAQSSSAPAAPAGSYQEYALGQLGGDGGQFSCLENLWGKESGWNPNAQNPTSTAYGIPQFLDSTWAGTGVAKTSDGYRQIDAGLIYIQQRYGSPCAAWSHSQANNWY